MAGETPAVLMKKPLRIPQAATGGWLVLIGGGEFSFGETVEVDRFIVAKIPPDRHRVAFVPTASGSSEYAIHFGKYLSELDAHLEVTNVPIYRIRDARRGKNLEALATAGLIYFGGGVVNRVAQTFGNSPAVDALRTALRSGAVVAANGASASALGVVCRDMHRLASVIRGAALVPEVAIETGFDMTDPQMLRRLMSAPDVKLGLGIPPKTGLAIGPDGNAEIIGDGQVAVVRKHSGTDT